MFANTFLKDVDVHGAHPWTSVRPGGWRRQPLQCARPASVSVIPGKRLMDMAIATLALTLLLPVMGLIAVAIRLDSRGPAIFRQTRIGRGGAPFTILKFRTMHVSASHAQIPGLATGFGSRLGRIQVSATTPGVTRLGRWLRATSLDELPQLLNVLRGDMSLVGPRPHLADLDGLFRPLLPHIARRYAVSPGMTGLAQVNGHRGPTPDVTAMAERLSDDLAYIQNQCLSLDLRILALTPMQLLSPSRRAVKQTFAYNPACTLPIWSRDRYTGERCRASGDRCDGRRPRVDIQWIFPEARRGPSWRRPTGSNGRSGLL